MEHTPGPWGVHFDEDANQFEIFQDKGRGFGPMLAKIVGMRGAFSANAHLIAAAPDLLAACERIMQEAARDTIDESEWSEGERMAHAAIMKARGIADT